MFFMYYMTGLAVIGFVMVTFSLWVDAASGIVNKLTFKIFPFWAGVFILVPIIYQVLEWYSNK